MRLILTRHGQTQWNHQHRTQGRTDVPLDKTGQAQAAAFARRIEGVHLDAVYSSPLSRAYDTAFPAAQAAGLRVIPDDRLVEREFGDWEGVAFGDLEKQFPGIWKEWLVNPYAAQPPRAESMEAVKDRCADFLEYLFSRYRSEETVLVVCHSIPARFLIALLLQLPLTNLHSIRLENASYTEFFCTEQCNALVTYNDTCHLKGIS